MSQNIGRAPLRATVPAVAKNVDGVVITSSPGPIPKAMRASSNASVPEETPTACAHRQYCAAAFSNSVTYGPRMNCWLAQILSRTGIISAANAWYCPFRSSRGTVIAGVKLGTTAILMRQAFDRPWTFDSIQEPPARAGAGHEARWRTTAMAPVRRRAHQAPGPYRLRTPIGSDAS